MIEAALLAVVREPRISGAWLLSRKTIIVQRGGDDSCESGIFAKENQTHDLAHEKTTRFPLRRVCRY